jgi:hypothetical protein
MSLSTWERQVLESIKEGLSGSALAARLAIFTRLSSGEEMPAWEKLNPGSREVVPRSRPGPPAGRRPRRLGLSQAALLVWLVTSVALIAVAFVLNRPDTHGSCTGTWTTLCGGAASAPKSGTSLP